MLCPLVGARARPFVILGKRFSEGHADEQIDILRPDKILPLVTEFVERRRRVLEAEVNLRQDVVHEARIGAPAVHIGVLLGIDGIQHARRADAEQHIRILPLGHAVQTGHKVGQILPPPVFQ